jgi:hypothetical protein
MILGAKTRSVWCAELSLINSALKLEDFNRVTLPIEITIQHSHYNPKFGVWCISILSFCIGTLPLVAMLAM